MHGFREWAQLERQSEVMRHRVEDWPTDAEPAGPIDLLPAEVEQLQADLAQLHVTEGELRCQEPFEVD